MDIGITLLYSATEEKNLLGVLKSYVIECKDKFSVLDAAQKKSEQQINLYFPNYKFLGIEDVFSVTGKVAEGELMGRSTLYDIESIAKAKELVQHNINFSREKGGASNNYCGSLVYFYEGGNEVDKGYAFTVLAIVKGETKETAIKNLKKLATDNRTINKIIENSIETLLSKKISFVGIEDIYTITEDVENGGSFLSLFNEDYQTEKELLSILPSKDELNDIINDVFIVLPPAARGL